MVAWGLNVGTGCGRTSINLVFKGKRKNQKNSQAVSPLNLSSRGRRDEKIAHFCFLQNFHLQKNNFETKFRKLFGKEKAIDNG